MSNPCIKSVIEGFSFSENPVWLQPVALTSIDFFQPLSLGGIWDCDGWRPGRNPPSVLGSIHLIGVPAPHTVLIGAYYSFHNVGRLFHPHQAAQRLRIIVCGLARSPFCARARTLIRHFTCYAPALWVEFPQAKARKLPTGSPTIKSLAWWSQLWFSQPCI